MVADIRKENMTPRPEQKVNITGVSTAEESLHFAETMLKQIWNHFQDYNGIMTPEQCIKLAEAFIYLADVKGRNNE